MKKRKVEGKFGEVIEF